MPAINIKSKPFPTLGAAQQWQQDYYKQYHPYGYGTHLVIKPTPEGYVVTGGRWDSCD